MSVRLQALIFSAEILILLFTLHITSK